MSAIVSCYPDSSTNSQITNPNCHEYFDQSDQLEQIIFVYFLTCFYCNLGILLPKLFWPTVRKKCFSDQEKRFKFEAEG